MVVIETDVKQFYTHMAEIEKKFFGTQFYNFATNNTLIGLASTLTKVLNYYKTLFKADPYETRVFYVHVISYINYTMEPTTENRLAMERVFENFEKILDVAQVLQEAPPAQRIDEK